MKYELLVRSYGHNGRVSLGSATRPTWFERMWNRARYGHPVLCWRVDVGMAARFWIYDHIEKPLGLLIPHKAWGSRRGKMSSLTPVDNPVCLSCGRRHYASSAGCPPSLEAQSASMDAREAEIRAWAEPNDYPMLRDLLSIIDGLRAERDAYHRAKTENDDRYMAERDETRAEVRQLRAAVSWALGEGDEFPGRPVGAGPYWWRAELRRRLNAPDAPTAKEESDGQD